MLSLLLLVSIFTLVTCQDTYHCPDGWYWQEHHGRGHCFFFSMEQVTKDDASILCGFHDGWIAEITHPGLNYWIKAMLLELYTPNEKAPLGNQFWLGAVTQDHHDDHVNGNWIWPHVNQTVDWFDWGDGEPNDFYTQFCLTYMEYRNILFPMFRDYFWNDWDCTEVAHYICVKECADCATTTITSTTPVPTDTTAVPTNTTPASTTPIPTTTL